MLILNESVNSKTYFSSDWHLGHQRDFVWGSRGYASADDHTNTIIDTTNSIVGPDDNLINNGDLCLNSTLEQFENYIQRLICKNIYLLWGNHNNPHEKKVYYPLVKSTMGAAYISGQRIYPLRYKNIIFLGDYREVSVNGQFICLCHYPIMSWNHISSGSWMIHGHMHCNNNPTNGKILDVGWDAYKKPLSFAEVKAIMDTRTVVGDGGHHI